MEQRELAVLLSQHTDTSFSLSNASIYTLTAIITAALQHGERVEIAHLGVFSSEWIAPCKINPRGHVRPIPGHWRVCFKPSARLQKALRDALPAPKVELYPVR